MPQLKAQVDLLNAGCLQVRGVRLFIILSFQYTPNSSVKLLMTGRIVTCMGNSKGLIHLNVSYFTTRSGELLQKLLTAELLLNITYDNTTL